MLAKYYATIYPKPCRRHISKANERTALITLGNAGLVAHKLAEQGITQKGALRCGEHLWVQILNQ